MNPKKNLNNKDHSNKDRSNRKQWSSNKKNRTRRKKKTTRISEHFSKKDFACTETKKLRISLGLIGALELLRNKAKKRINILKGYESPDSPKAKKKFGKNYHTQGIAADIQIEGLTPVEVFLLAEEVTEFNGIGLNIEESYVHVDTRKEDNRFLWIETESSQVEINESNRDQYIKKTAWISDTETQKSVEP